jgi:hypothetical protein
MWKSLEITVISVLLSYVFKLIFKNPASYIKDGRNATLQMLHFIYFFFYEYKYRVL